MRRSKSDPAKYARNYRRISNRRMTEHGDIDEEKEMERLRSVLRNSEAHLQRAAEQNGSDDDLAASSGKKRTRTKKQKRTIDTDCEKNHECDSKSEGSPEIEKKEMSSILSPEMQAEMDAIGGESAAIILPRKKKAKSAPKIELTPEEIRQAKAQHKNATRKLKQLADRAQQKKRRAELYSTLRENAISGEEMSLLSSSSTLGKRLSKKEQLQRLVRKERAGIPLTEEEKDLLYTEHKMDETGGEVGAETFAKKDTRNNGADETATIDPDANIQSKKRKKKKKKQKNVDSGEQPKIEAEVEAAENKEGTNVKASNAKEREDASEPDRSEANTKYQNDDVATKNNAEKEGHEAVETKATAAFNGASFAAQMMAGLSTLKVEATTTKIELDKKEAEAAALAEKERQAREEAERRKRTRYVPSEPIVLKSAARMGISQEKEGKKNWRVLPVDRPDSIEETRYDLPVSAMEFEIIDAVRSNDATILCSETGSGKSTQVPQFLYEAGITLGNASSEAEDNGLLIGVTQPRRVAAVSTAKRICYEMGQSEDGGRSIRGRRGEGNLVAYQTRYESAGLGEKTRIKFMTDGILLQEIQSDLLLRRYGAIVLDEAHERNLNTDVLLGLLSTALPLRQKAAEEGSMPPLKLIIMSATLRVEDFTANKKLFPGNPPAIVKVPGRTHPVTIHHSKRTELDDYENAAFNKVCKIHRRLPPGGILVFLTGKQEIVQMVNRLRKTLSPKDRQGVRGRRTLDRCTGDHDVTELDDKECSPEFDGGTLRDMDDDEVDGDLFQNNEHDDFDEMQSNPDDEEEGGDSNGIGGEKGEGEEGPQHVVVLPLYSLLSVQEQAKVFEPVPDGSRLIVVATNIAETSLTIPGISYVVDSGRQKCRNFHAGTGIASYDVMWISRAAADQRAGRAGRTGPGHCYRLYSSSLYSRHLDPFALPEVLTRPLEDVVLAMKAMNVSNVASFPFPTAPDQAQLNAAVHLLARIGCVDLSKAEATGGDGRITRLGAAVAKLPLGVRYGKMLLVSAQAKVLDYGIVMVAALSESSPFLQPADSSKESEKEGIEKDNRDGLDEVDCNAVLKEEEEKKRQRKLKWAHRGGDILSSMLAVGAYTYAGRGSGGASEASACKRFCEENGLNFVVMERIQKMRKHLAKLAKTRLGSAEGIAAKTGGILTSMPPPNKLQENLLMQAIASGNLDRIARRAPPSAIIDRHTARNRTSYLSCNASMTEPLFIDPRSALFSKDVRKLPEWVCFDSCIRKATKDGSTISTMKNLTPVDPAWLAALSDGSELLSLSAPLATPPPTYDRKKDAVLCSVETKFGSHGWLVAPRQVEMYDAVRNAPSQGAAVLVDDSFRWFARFLLEGKVVDELSDLPPLLNDDPAIITRRKPVSKVAVLVSSLASAGIDSASALRKHWAEKDSKFLFKHMKSWTKSECVKDVKNLWMNAVKTNIDKWKTRAN